MVAVVKKPADQVAVRGEPLTRESVYAMVKDQIVPGSMDPTDACKAVYDILIAAQERQGQHESLARLIGYRVVWEIYWQMARRDRITDPIGRKAFTEAEEAALAAVELVSESVSATITPIGRRKHDPAGLRSFLEAEYKVGERTVLLGDMTKDDCQKLSDLYRQRSHASAQKSTFFATLAKELKPDTKVRQRYDSATLLRLLDMSA